VRHLPLPGGGLQISASGTIVATAAGSGPGCVGAVYRSIDLGATWSELPGSCRRMPLRDVQFVDADHAVAVGGWSYKSGGGRVIETTSDGGRHWQVTKDVASTASGNRIIDGLATVDFVSPTVGFVLDGPCDEGQDDPCEGTLYRTVDGGHHLHRLPTPGLTKGWLTVASTTDGGFLVAGDDAGGAVGNGSSDRLRLRIRPRAVFTDTFAGAGNLVLWHNSLGTYITRTAGERWRHYRPPSLRGDVEDNGVAVAAPGDVLTLGRPSDPVVVRSSVDAGVHWRAARLTAKGDYRDDVQGFSVGEGGEAAVVTGADEGQLTPAPSRLYLSADAGRRWGRPVHLPFALDPDAEPLSIAVDAQVLAVADGYRGLEVSTDRGRSWRRDVVSRQDFCGVSSYRSELWLVCQVGAETWVLHSRDRGLTWTGFDLGTKVEPDVASIVATGAGRAAFSDGGEVWRSSNGGSTWHGNWPLLPGEGRGSRPAPTAGVARSSG
jgi:photosystem II stability/assembly factor-like uncharacterized protein